MKKTILLAGATGLVGSACLPLLLADERVAKVIALVRRPLSVHAKLEQWVDADLLKALRPQPVDAVICCLGTTIKKAGSQPAFVAVDKDLPLGLARWAKAQGVPAYAIISAIGADAGSRIFYSSVKGEVEQELEAMGFAHLAMFQPSVLVGPRQEKRAGEGLAATVLKMVGPLMVGGLRKWRIMPHTVLAQALVHQAVMPEPGINRFTYAEIVERARPQKLATRS